jgi:hypothetical protein
VSGDVVVLCFTTIILSVCVLILDERTRRLRERVRVLELKERRRV